MSKETIDFNNIEENDNISASLHPDNSQGKDLIEFRRFFDDFYPKLLAVACRFVDEETAKDIVQDSFILFWEMKATSIEIKQTRSFLFKIVQNKCLNFIKRQETIKAYEVRINIAKRRIAYLNESLDTNETLKQLELQEIQIKLEEAIQKLPQKCEQAFRLRFFEEMSYKEIAEMMCVSPRTVESHIARAISQLRPLLKHLFVLTGVI